MLRSPVNTTIMADPREDKGGVDLPADPIGSSGPTTVEPPPSSRRFCEGTVRRGIVWPQTHRGMNVERPCPKGTKGMRVSYVRMVGWWSPKAGPCLFLWWVMP